MEDRPRYHNERDLVAEREIAAEIEAACGIQLQTTILSEWAYRIDFCLSGGWRKPVLGYAEVKNRPNLVYRKYSGYQIAAHKVAFAQLLRASGIDVKSWAFVRAQDGAIYCAEFGHKPLRQILGGRTDRGNVYDVEPMAIIPWEDFQPLAKAAEFFKLQLARGAE
jgi:hypothetical protein